MPAHANSTDESHLPPLPPRNADYLALRDGLVADSPPPRTPSPTGTPTPSMLEVPIPSVLQPGPPSRPSSPSIASPTSLSSPSSSTVFDLPTVSDLELSFSSIDQPDVSPELKVAWCHDVLLLLGRATSIEPDAGAATVHDPALLALVQIAVSAVEALSANFPEAKYIHAKLASSGAVPGIVPYNRQLAFREFEASARAGYSEAWFNLGSEYETFGDLAHARDCFGRGVALNVASCLYRMGIANLLGQLELPTNIPTALPLLARAAASSSLRTPQPAYALALLLLGEFDLAVISPSELKIVVPSHSSPVLEAKALLEQAAYFHYAPAQYKLGHAYEFALNPWPYDPLTSVEWYSKSKTMESDMALSRWFLCGAEGVEKDEGLAWVFAEKAAGKGFVSAEFAMGYYCEVGVAGKNDIEKAISWYNTAASHGNTEAKERLQALNLPTPSVITRSEHETLTGETLVRRRTKAKTASDARANTFPSTTTRSSSRHILDNLRKETISEGMYPAPMTPPKTPSPPPTSNNLLAPQMPGRKRFSLVDPGFKSASDPPSRSPSPGPRPPGRRTPPRGGTGDSSSGGELSDGPRKPAPATFAEMGIGSTSLVASDKGDCIVM